MALALEQLTEEQAWYIGRIPVRNLWLLMLYASDLFQHRGQGQVDVEENPDDIPNLVAEILCYIVDQRLARNLTSGYVDRREILRRVRGRIDLLRTERHQLMSKGQVACRFHDLTVDTFRNRYVLCACEKLAGLVTKPDLSHRLRVQAGRLKRLGVQAVKPSWAQVSTNRIGRHDANDISMLHAARLAFDLALPAEEAGGSHLLSADRAGNWVRRLFEKAVCGFYSVVLAGQDWKVEGRKMLRWQVEQQTPGMTQILPGMKTDIFLENRAASRRIIIDTKFTDLLTAGHYRQNSLKSGNLYQLYAYLRSQDTILNDPLVWSAEGVLLYPVVSGMIDEAAVIQGHLMRFATVDLTASTADIRQQLLRLLASPFPG